MQHIQATHYIVSIALGLMLDQNAAKFDDMEPFISPFTGCFRTSECCQTIALDYYLLADALSRFFFGHDKSTQVPIFR